MTVALPALAEVEHLLERLHSLRPRVDGESGLTEVGQDLGVALEAPPLDRTDAVTPEPEGPGRRHGRVLLAQRSGGGVAGIGEDLVAALPELLVEPLECLHRQVDLATDLQGPGMCWRAAGAPQPHRKGADRPDVRRDVVADVSVPAP